MTLALGARHSFGLYLQPMTSDLGWARQTFAFALAAQNLIYGLSQPLSGMLADKFGAARVMLCGTVLYVIGLVLMSGTTTGLELTFSAGVLIGTAISCMSFPIVFGTRGRTTSCGASPLRRASSQLWSIGRSTIGRSCARR